jgi:4-amino-4-deoxy-L-arabinose transferase-like glycosyltransferase
MRLSFFFLAHPWETETERNIVLTGDAPGYHKLAITMLAHGQYAYELNGAPDTLRPPVYPSLISVLYFLFGAFPWVVLLFQAVLDSASCLLLYAALMKFGKQKIAFVTGIFYAADPYLIFYSDNLLSESVFIFLCLAAFFFFTNAAIKQFSKKSTVDIGLAAFFFGLGCLTRPVLSYLPLIAVPYFLFTLRRHLHRGLVLSAVFTLVFLLTIFPWLMRNIVTFHTPALSSSASYNLLILQVTPMEMERRGEQNTLRMQDILKSEADSLARQDGRQPECMTGFEKSSYQRQLAFFYIAHYPGAFITQYFKGLLSFFTSTETYTISDWLCLRKATMVISTPFFAHPLNWLKAHLQYKSPAELAVAAYILGYQALAYFCLCIGFFGCMRRNKDKSYFLFLILMVLYFLFLTGSAGQARFRLPAIPFYLFFVGTGFSFLQEKMKGTPTRLLVQEK